MVTPDRWRQLEELYHSAIGLPAADRHRLLENADPELREAVIAILSADDSPSGSADSLLDRPAWEGRESLLDTQGLVSAGARLGPYVIKERIGRGGMGEVFRATDTRLNRTVAIKTSPVQFTARFQREARAIAALNHPHIAMLYDVGSGPSGLGYLVLEYVEGPTLAERIQSGPIPREEVRRIALMTAEAIECAHDKGIVHRDLKPANIKLRDGDVVKVLDFGLAKAMADSDAVLPGETTQHGMVLGTPFYMSPEQALGGPVDRRSDIWSFGALLGEMLCGRRIFRGDNSKEILASVVRGEPDLSGVPADWMPLLRRCLTKDVRTRLQSIGEARVALEQGLPVLAETGPRRRVWPWLLPALAAALAVMAGILWKSRSAPEPENPLTNATFTQLTNYEGTQVDASISPDGKFVAFLSDRDGPSHVWLQQIGAGNPVDLTPGTQDQRGPLRSIGFSWDGTQLWISGTESRRLRLLPLVGGTPRVFLREKAVNPIWAPDGSKLAYHTSEPGDPIFIADSDGSNPKQLFKDTPDKHNHYLSWSADGKWIYCIHGTPATNDMDLWRIAVFGGQPERLTELKTDIRDPTPFGPQTVLFLANERNGSGPWIQAYDLVSRKTRRIAFGLDQYTSLSASADGRRLVVTVANPSVRLWSVPISGSEATEADVRPFLPAGTHAMDPRFRGPTLFYLSSYGTSDGGGDRLWRLDGEHSAEVWGGAQNRAEAAPAVSRDGRRILLVTREGAKRRLRLLSADGAESRIVAPDLDVEGSADWSPDGRAIVIGGSDENGEGLFKIPAAGGGPIRLTAHAGRNPVWSPDGSVIAYSGPNVFTLTPLLAVRPDGTPVKMPDIRTERGGERVRFMPDGHGLIFMRGPEATPWQDFWLLDLRTMSTRRLTRLADQATMRTFDVTADGKRIVFDRLRENSAVVLIDTEPGR